LEIYTHMSSIFTDIKALYGELYLPVSISHGVNIYVAKNIFVLELETITAWVYCGV